MAYSFDKLKELDLSRDEVERIGEALKNPEFRKLFTDYVEELQDPKNRETFEKEVTELERERGNEVTFIHPKPGYVIKTSVNGSQKAFVNICVNEKVNKPNSKPSVKNGERGLQWSLPHSLSPPREGVDNKGLVCKVFDVVFHPNTLHLASKNKAFRDIVNSTALDAVEANFDVALDKKNIKFPKLNYKGMPKACVLRKPSGQPPAERTAEEKALFDKLFEKAEAGKTSFGSPRKTKKRSKRCNDTESDYATPKFTIKHRSHVDIQEFVEHKNAKLNAAIPKELIVEIDLPLLKSSSDINLDVSEKTVQLVSERPAKYKLNITLPYIVNDAVGSAKFDKDLRKLVITLPVKCRSLSDMGKDDSGVESDMNLPNTPNTEQIEIIQTKNVLNNLSEDLSECVQNETEIKSSQFRTFENFLNKDYHYSMPEFNCNVFENIIAFTLCVKNVDENSVCKVVSEDGKMMAIKFTSISSSFFQTHYAFFVKFPVHSIERDNINVEIWDNNVILQIPLMACDKLLESYLCGTNEENLVECFIEEPVILNKVLKEAVEVKEDFKVCPIEEKRKVNEELVDKSSENFERTTRTNNMLTTHTLTNGALTTDALTVNKKLVKHKSKVIDIATSYESSGDELSCSSFSPRRSKGILKRSPFRSILGRSISESSLDEYVCSSFENCHTSLEFGIPEEDEVSTSLKKTVRFNDVVKQQLYRSNSSILGQKKKNQRKARNKKRAHDRRHSESEISDIVGKKEEDSACEKDEESEDQGKSSEDNDIFQIEINN